MRLLVDDILAVTLILLQILGVVNATNTTVNDMDYVRITYSVHTTQVDNKLYVNASVRPGEIVSMTIRYSGITRTVNSSSCILVVNKTVPEVLVTLRVNISNAIYIVATKTYVSFTETTPKVNVSVENNSIVIKTWYPLKYRLTLSIIRERNVIRTTVYRETMIANGTYTRIVDNLPSGRYVVNIVVNTMFNNRYSYVREVVVSDK